MSSSGRPTGTVPKVKSRQNTSTSSRDLEQRRAPISSMPNNLQASSLDWQQSTAHHQQSSSSQSRSRKPRNTRSQLSRGLFDTGLVSDTHVSHERLRGTSSDFSSRSLHSDFMMDGERCGESEARIKEGSSSQTSSRRQDQPHNTLLDTKNNISKIPDRNQVLSRLNQIRDYVKQTSALMDSLRGSSDPPLDNCSTPEHLERFTQLLDLVKTQEDTCLGLFKDGSLGESLFVSPQTPPNGALPRSRGHSGSEGFSQSRSRSSSEEPRSLPTAAQYAKHQELRLKVEESQKKLLALQEHQAALVALQHKAQEQLREAQAQQGALLAHADDDPQSNISTNMENLNSRMQTLQDMFLNRNEVAHLLGEQDEDLEAEHSALQERLQELHGRKQTMERLARDLQAFGEAPTSHNDAAAHQNGVSTSHEDSSDDEVEEEASEVVDKMEELNRMKARLAQLQAMVAAVNNGDVPHETVKAALTSGAVFRVPDSQRGDSSSKPDNNVLSSESTPSSYLEAQVLEIQMKTQQLDKAKQRLQQLRELLGAVGMADDDTEEGEDREDSASQQQAAQLSLDQVQALSREMQSLSMQAEREQLVSAQHSVAKSGPSSQHPSQHNKNKNTATAAQQRRTHDTPDPSSSRQLAIQAELRAKRQELEELMRKDQGQSSSLNQDTCSEAGVSLPETSATWGGSSSSQTAMLATVEQDVDGQEPSMACSSDDALDETMIDASTSQMPTSRHRHTVPHPPPHLQPGWHQYRTGARKDSSDSRATTPHNAPPWIRAGVPDPVAAPYDLPGSVGSSRATPRPPSEAGSNNTQQHMPWWPMQVQQQLEVTSAMCQAMMQQWQWPGAEPWWNMQGQQQHQQQQQLVLTLSQCCQMLWMQHREMAALQATVLSLQERIACAERCGLGATAAPPDNNQAPPPTSHHQPLKVSLSTGLFPTSPSEQAAAAGASVSSAHSLPNLCEGPPPSVFPPFAWMSPPPAPRTNTQVTAPPGIPPMLRHGPPVTLNNQVPPGIRANNYWDNFRSYSRQNLLSTSTKTNEGHMHNPSPIADRSHNSLRGADPHQMAPPASTVNVTQPPYRGRKQKLNTEQRPLTTPSTSNSSTSPARHNPHGPSLPRHPMPSSSSSQPRSVEPTQEQLYSELTTLVAQNQSRPDFLPQLFRELQALSSDSTLCQRALQSIRELSHAARADTRNCEPGSHMRPTSRESLASHHGEKDDRGSEGGASLLEEAAGSDESAGSQEGATALPTRSLPRNMHSLEPCSPDLASGGLNVSSGHGHLDTEIQGVILQLLPFLKSHREDCCTLALLEAVRQRTLALVPHPSTGLNGFIQGQLDALLEDAMLKFQGCWLRDVGEELLTTIAEVLLNELTFFKLLDSVGRSGQVGHVPADSTSHQDDPCQTSGLPNPPAPQENMLEGGADAGHTSSLGQRACWLPARLRDTSGPGAAPPGWETRADPAVLEAESLLGCDGDLAEADQSHEELTSTTAINCVTTSEPLVEPSISGRNSQAEGIADEDSSSDEPQEDLEEIEEIGAAALSDNHTPAEDEGWNVEQDRELDQVPTRLEPGGNAPPSLPTSPPPPSSSPRP